VDILTGRFGRFYQALFNLNQPLTLGAALPDVMPVVDITRPTPDLSIYSGVFRCSGATSQTGAAGEQAQVALRANPNTNRVIVLESVIISSNANQLVHMGHEALNGVAVTGDKGYLDSRLNSEGTPSADVTSYSTATPPSGAIGRVRVAANAPIQIPINAVLFSPDNTARTWYVITQTVTTVLTVQFLWTERAIGQQETKP
jgi:hypothetical protein